MLTLVVLCAHAVLMVAAVLVVGRKPVQWAVSSLFFAGCFLLEWFAPVDVTWHAIMAFGGIFALLAAITVAVTATPPSSARFRLLPLLTLGYRIRAGCTRPVVSFRIIGRLSVEALAIGAAWLLLRHFLRGQPPVSVGALGRLLAGIVFFYAMAEFVSDLVHFGFLASGTAMRPIFVTPVAATSLRDFWGQRWNRAVNACLYRFIFSPLAHRHRPRLGLIGAFVVSAALHAWLPLVALGASAAFSVGAFFCLQGVFILVEDRLQVRAWRVPLARVWTLTILLATSPLFIYPFLALLHL
ncbi:MAG TPA: MBOAT family protein [Candidatus Sulfotelmatobacter sp.]|nr:MBOAT family protein [Candidatus Sulfotelmatobacter sp.]